jgi:peroxiredoxin Q/BCP
MAEKVVSVLKEGDVAPEVQLQTDSGDWFTLSGLKGDTVVLYFYPRADTPGCTTEACEFRDSIERFPKHHAVIVGVSPDTPAAQAKFKAKYALPFTLLADVDKKAAQAYGVWKEKTLYGKKSMGIVRSTFVIGPDGHIRKIFPKVRAAGHAAQVLEALVSL